jgi:hypothetical protein
LFNRREVISTLKHGTISLLGLNFAPGLSGIKPAYAFGDRDKVSIQFLDYGKGAHARLRAAEQLMWEVNKRTSINVKETPTWVSPTQHNLYSSPLLVWLGRGPCPQLSQTECLQLNQYLRAGGLLYIDDISASGDQRFDQSIREELKRIWPENRLKRVDKDHTIYRSFFLLDRPHGRIQRRAYLEHISFDNLSPILYGRNDLFGAFGRDLSGQWKHPVTPGGSVQREAAFRFGINLVMYATCLNYKRDQVHTLSILRRRQFQAE